MANILSRNVMPTITRWWDAWDWQGANGKTFMSPVSRNFTVKEFILMQNVSLTCLTNLIYFISLSTCTHLWRLENSKSYFLSPHPSDTANYWFAYWNWLERFSFECRKVIGFAFTTLRDWFKKLAPIFHPIRSETKTNRDSLVRVFLRFASATCNYFVFWLVHLIVCVLCDWLEWLLWFWFYDTPLKTALYHGYVKLIAIILQTLWWLPLRCDCL